MPSAPAPERDVPVATTEDEEGLRVDVSVVIPCRDAARYLAQTIGSVLEQDQPPQEVIVVDDGSTDASLRVAQRFQAHFPDQVQVRRQRAGGAPAARNLGALAATGDALLFLDADDVLAPDTLPSLVAALEHEPGGVAICPWFRMVESDGRFVERPPSSAPRRPGDDPLSAWLTNWYHPPCTVMWSRSAFERAGRWDELSASNQDGDLMMRALAVEVPLVSVSTGAGYYRLAASGHSSLAYSRFTRRGILSRLRTLRKIAAWLQERGLLTDYLPPLHAAFRLIARDLCADEPDLRMTALAEAKRFRPRAARRLRRHTVRLGFQATRQAKRRARRLAGAVRRRLTGQGPAGRSEVAFGRLTAQTLGSEGSDALPPATGLDRPAVSVVVPTYDRAHVLPRAIGSALNQTMPDLELLVVDDASTDATSETVAAYDDERLRYLSQPENRGVSAARNRGLREARGEFIAFLDSADEWLPDKLAFQVARLRSLPEEVGLLYGGVANHDGRQHRDTHLPSRRGAIYRDLLVFNPIHGTSSVVIRRSVVATAY